MNKFKKILSTVLALGLVASTLVLPVSVEADDYVINESFDGTVAENFLGKTASAYEIVAGNTIDTLADGTGDKASLGLKADDKVLHVTGRNYYFVENGLVPNTGGSHGAQYTGNHATYEFDFWIYNMWNKIGFSSGSSDRYGIMIGGRENADELGTGIGEVKICWGDSTKADTVNNSTDKVNVGLTDTAVTTIGRRAWHRAGIEYDYSVTPAVMKVYIDNEPVATQNLYESDRNVPVDMNFYSTESYGHNFINNFKFYDGAYQASALPVTYFENNDFSDANETTAFATMSGASAVQADGFAGKAASDKVALLTTGGSGHRNDTGTHPAAIVTGEASFLPSSGNKALLYNGTAAGGVRYGLKLEGGVLSIATCDGWTYEAVAGYDNIDMTVWHKLAVEINSVDGKYYFYFDGVKVGEKTCSALAFGITTDFRIQTVGYIDDYREYNKAYQGDAAITAASTAKVTVDGTTLKAAEGTTLDELKATVAASDAITFYSDDALTTATTSVDAAKYMVVEYGELYKKYTLNITSPYGTKLVWNDMSADGNTDGFAGKASTDKVMMVTANYRPSLGGSYTGITSGQVSYEASVYLTSGSKASIAVLNNGAYSERGVVKLEGGKVYTRAAGDAYSNATHETSYTYEANTWNKVAIVKDATGWEFYLNGTQIATLADAALIANQYSSDFAIYDVSGTVYFDDYRVYTGDYGTMVDSAIADVAGAEDGVITVNEGATVADVEAMVTDGTAELYTSDLTTASTTLADSDVLIVNKGELYKSYTLNIESPYGDKKVWLTYTNSSDIYEGNFGANLGTQADGFAGKPASDKVSYHTDNYRPFDYGTTLTSDSKIMTYEAQVFFTDKFTMHVYDGNGETTRSRIKIENGVLQYRVGSDWTTSEVSYETNTWNKLVIVRNKIDNTYTFYINGQVIAADVAAASSTADTTFANDFGFEVGSGMYVDNYRIYTADYVADATIADVAGATDGVITVTEGTTVAQVKAMVTDGTAEVYKSDLATVSTTLADGDVLIINKGELYKAYTIHVATKYEDANLAVNFDTQSIADTGSGWAGLATSSWAMQNKVVDGALAIGAQAITPSYVAGLGGKAASDYAIKYTVAKNADLQENARLQAGYGSANANATGTVYTVEADVYLVEGAQNASILIKMLPAEGSGATGNIQPSLYAPATANRWYKLAMTVDTTNGTVQGYVNGVPTETNHPELGDYTVFSDQVNAQFGEDSTTAIDNFRVYAGAYRGGVAPTVAASVQMDAGATVADVLAETGADFVVDANGNKVASNAAAVATGYQAVKVDGEMFGYTNVNVTAAITNVDFSTLATGEVYEKDGVEYVFVAVTTGTISDISLYKTFACTDGVDTEGKALSEMIDTTVTGPVQLGVLVMNVPAANKDNFKAKLLLEDIANIKAD